MILIQRDGRGLMTEFEVDRWRSVQDELNDGVLAFLKNYGQLNRNEDEEDLALQLVGLLTLEYGFENEQIDDASDNQYQKRYE